VQEAEAPLTPCIKRAKARPACTAELKEIMEVAIVEKLVEHFDYSRGGYGQFM
jgi:hypothetical protein